MGTEIVRCIICKRKLRALKSVERKMGYCCYRRLKNGYCGLQLNQFDSVEQIKEVASVINDL
jgi:hypothetical protein